MTLTVLFLNMEDVRPRVIEYGTAVYTIVAQSI